MRKTSARVIPALAVLLLVACNDGDDGTTGPSSTVQSVAVIPGVVALIAGDTLRLTTLARGPAGNPIVGRPVTWTSSSPGIASVSRAGVATAVTAGAALITATIDGIAGTAAITVSPRLPGVAFASVVTGGAHTCALATSGAAHCWGRGERGQLGVAPPGVTCLQDLEYPCNLVPVPIDGGLTFQTLTAGVTHTCGLTSNGSAYCWGSNTNGQLGDSSTTNRNAPVAVATSVKFSSIDAGHEHTCALTTDGTAYCWGWNHRGQLGDGTTTRRLTPMPVTGGRTFQRISAGGSDFVSLTCALTVTGEAYCWGQNDRGQLGTGTRTFTAQPAPLAVSGGFTFASLSVGSGGQVCALTAANAAYCWGANTSGALGDGSMRDSFAPLPVSGGLTFAQFALGGSGDFVHSCGLTTTGAAYCWGDNEVGTVGDGSTNQRLTPTAVAGGVTFASLDAGGRHTCGRSTSGALYCWGSGRVGQLGSNSMISKMLPAKVIGQP